MDPALLPCSAALYLAFTVTSVDDCATTAGRVNLNETSMFEIV